ncbi:PleD family two-component system response regulator [Legionella dresdenensis]|uniref:PleD family two-component system response regulator n=1 Tax=Legionella dresdenensis TaxID=450200 RepID=A0ABV8CH18_9GAMM
MMKRVILIDDSKTARAMLKRIFVELGDWEIMEASNGLEALEQLARVPSIDLACVDWNMPVMNGLEFITEAKKKMKGVWMMMVTSETEMNNMYKAMVAGANEYVMKPFTKEVILAKLDMMGLAT